MVKFMYKLYQGTIEVSETCEKTTIKTPIRQGVKV